MGIGRLAWGLSPAQIATRAGPPGIKPKVWVTEPSEVVRTFARHAVQVRALSMLATPTPPGPAGLPAMSDAPQVGPECPAIDSKSPIPPVVSPQAADRLIAAFRRKVIPGEPSYRLAARAGHNQDPGRLKDLIFALPGDTQTPYEVFDQLRWGGQFIYITPDPVDAAAVAHGYVTDGGFNLDAPEGRFRRGLPFISRHHHYFIARKVALLHPGQTTHRFTFNVRLVWSKKSNEYVVLKQVPEKQAVIQRLCEKFPNLSRQTLADRAHKLCDHIFPVFLSREAAFLQLLQRDLPEEYRARFPRVLGAETGPDGLVRRVQMNWLRMGCHPLPHLEFARQSADLLRVLHDIAGVIHLDLRLDNFVITPHGVGFVDFGSAVRVGEQLEDSPLLRSLFDEMMSTSKIQQHLGHMIRSGRVTSSTIVRAHQKVDKAIDLFYLAMQMKKPHANPDFVGLIEFDDKSPVTSEISRLTHRVLRPADATDVKYRTAADLVQGIDRIRKRLSANGQASK